MSPQPSAAQAPATDETDPQVIGNVRQLSYTGLRAGEAYFNRDGTQLIYQSEREDKNPFYQIYTLNLLSGKIDRVSPGQGKTTCSWFHPDGERALFSSTHQDPRLQEKVKEEYEARRNPQKNRYSWSFDEEFKIYEKNLKSGKLKLLTPEHGYNAEGSYSPDGRLIAFASNRNAYAHPETLTAEDQKLFSQDPSYMMDIYIMNADGSNVRQLTDVRGYDGGPFFSPDGRKITWRRFAPNGQSAEIYTMNLDGSEQKALTKIKAMSWAPFFHPSGDYLIFTTNTQGYANFELYIVDAEGKHEPVRVSHIPEFDGLPVFHPNGREIVWTHKTEKGDGQLFRADWDDAKARALLALPPAQAAAIRVGQFSSVNKPLEISPQSVQQTVDYLAQPEFAGRLTGSEQEARIARELSSVFQQIGLSPVGENGGYLASFPFTSQVDLGPQTRAAWSFGEPGKPAWSELETGKDFVPLSFSRTGTAKGGVVFAGYGLVAPATEKLEAFDSYAHTDVKGKWALILRDIPENLPADKRVELLYFSRLQNKVQTAAQKGAVGVLVVSDKIAPLHFEGASTALSLPVIGVSKELADKLLASTGRNLAQWTEVLDTGTTQAAEIKTREKEVLVDANIDLIWTRSTGNNVVGELKVPGAKETVVIGAHLDHLGHGEFGSSLAKDEEKGQIHPGADDNASGVAGVLALAHQLAAETQAGLIHPQRNIIFALWSGEELGLLGSTHWVRNFAASHGGKNAEKIVANINLDMIGRYQGKLQVQGLGSAKEWKGLFEKAALQTPVNLILQDDPYLPSDSMAFYLENIPTVMFFTGAHGEYHTPRDVASLINAQGEADVLNLVRRTLDELGASHGGKPLPITYAKAESSRGQMEGRSFRVYLGTIPDYTQEAVKGVLLSGTTKNSPAEKAGLAGNDVIVELAGLKIENLYDYVYALQTLKANKETQIKVLRKGEAKEFAITPEAKE
ncbi:M20/M25/M40 family metallo-hydrolase [Methylococcus sp. EFPC2]|uniref:M20/M25/M40 family metallo-hydrolase n=1 Tax=Methylococcus sp. EFPC2 TaxID=2812648 RepID=UPI001F0762B3|nr:M20/M25/M40 family metallo-hydrolase [Methylococcus sp. EFPC2]